MKRKLLQTLTAIALLVCTLVPMPALAASPSMPALGSSVLPVTVHLSGQFSASATGIVSLRVPFDMQVLYTTMVAQAKGGTQGTSTLTCNNGANAFTNAVDLTGTAGTILEATLVAAYQKLAKDATVTCDLVISGGSSPTLSNITVVIWAQRRR